MLEGVRSARDLKDRVVIVLVGENERVLLATNTEEQVVRNLGCAVATLGGNGLDPEVVHTLGGVLDLASPLPTRRSSTDKLVRLGVLNRLTAAVLSRGNQLGRGTARLDGRLEGLGVRQRLVDAVAVHLLVPLDLNVNRVAVLEDAGIVAGLEAGNGREHVDPTRDGNVGLEVERLELELRDTATVSLVGVDVLERLLVIGVEQVLDSGSRVVRTDDGVVAAVHLPCLGDVEVGVD